MKKLKAYLTSSKPEYVLRICHILFFGGLGTMVLSLLALNGTEENGVKIGMFLGILGVTGCAVGLIFAAVGLRCPHCDKSLMLGGRMPTALPNFCPECGKALTESMKD